MVAQDLMTVFVALTAVAVVIQTCILVGFYLLSYKLNLHAEQAIKAARGFVDPVHDLVENLKTVSANLSEAGAATQDRLRQFSTKLEEAQRSWKEMLHRWRQHAA